MIEVFADKGIDTNFDPMVVEDRFERQAHIANGIPCGLKAARVTAKGQRLLRFRRRVGR